MISPTIDDFSASSGTFRRHLAEILKLLKKHFSSTSIIEYSKLPFLVFDFSEPEIRLFNRKKKLVGYLVLSLNLWLLVMTVFHTYNNNILYRFCKFVSLASLSNYSSDKLIIDKLIQPKSAPSSRTYSTY